MLSSRLVPVHGIDLIDPDTLRMPGVIMDMPMTWWWQTGL
jgi:hypothetical protein